MRSTPKKSQLRQSWWTRTVAFSAAALMTIAMASIATAGVASAAAGGGQPPLNDAATAYNSKTSVDICHATGADNNPYGPKRISPNVDGIVPTFKGGNKHDSHAGPIWALGMQGAHITWGDIIPAFYYVEKKGDAAVLYSGLNWTAAGKAIWDASCAAPAQPVLTLTKTASPTVYSAPGQTISYTFTVTNTSSVKIKNLAIDELTFTGGDSTKLTTAVCAATSLTAHASTTCAATYTTQSSDATTDGQTIVNTARATGESNSGHPVISNESTATVTYQQPPVGEPRLSLVKSASPAVYSSAGDTITYTFHVVNTGAVDLTDLAIVETSFSGTLPWPTVTCGTTALAAGAQTDCTASYIITAADVTATRVDNTAKATATAKDPADVESNESSAAVTYAPAAGSLTLIKKVNSSTGTDISASTDLTQWTLSATDPSALRYDLKSGGSFAVTAPPTTYTLTETIVDGFDNGTAWACEISGDPIAMDPANEITVGIGQDITCTITNTQAITTGGGDTPPDTPTPPDTITPPDTVTPPAIDVAPEAVEVPPVLEVEGVQQEVAQPQIDVQGASQEVGKAPSANAHTGQGQNPWVYLALAVGLLLMLSAWRYRRSHEA